jgi:2-dehydro-3-deoxyphosphogalactonate aldolase
LPLVAILRGIEPDEAVAHARALLDAGFDCIEVPTNSPDWPRSIAAIVALAGTRALVGAGTVLTTDDLDRLQAAGGRLAVSPHVDPLLIADSVRRGQVTLSGAMTPSEVFAAWRAGARAVKLFPATTLGVAHVRAMAAVLPAEVSLFAVGGINVANLGEWRRAGCAGAGLGSDLYRPRQAPGRHCPTSRGLYRGVARRRSAAARLPNASRAHGQISFSAASRCTTPH